MSDIPSANVLNPHPALVAEITTLRAALAKAEADLWAANEDREMLRRQIDSLLDQRDGQKARADAATERLARSEQLTVAYEKVVDERDALKRDQADWRKGVGYIAASLAYPKPDLSPVDIGAFALELRAKLEKAEADLVKERAASERLAVYAAEAKRGLRPDLSIEQVWKVAGKLIADAHDAVHLAAAEARAAKAHGDSLIALIREYAEADKAGTTEGWTLMGGRTTEAYQRCEAAKKALLDAAKESPRPGAVAAETKP